MSTALPAIASGSSDALQAELLKAQRQLSDWVGCASAKTPSGKDHIATLRAEVQGIEQSLEKADRAKATQTAATPTAPALSPLGAFLDVYA